MSRVLSKQTAKAKVRKSCSDKTISEYEARATEQAEECLGRAYSLIAQFEDEGQFEEPISEEELIEELDCIRSDLDDCAEDGWMGYRDEMDRLSNSLWKIGVAWPQFLPYWSWADVVKPEDLKDEISETCLYREDLLAIRQFADSLKCRFKEAVHILVAYAENTLEEFPKRPKKRAVRKSSKSKARR